MSPHSAHLKSWLLAATVAVAALVAACQSGEPARFPHRLHLAGIPCGQPGKPECLKCNSCHATSERDRAHKLPEQALCDSCHRDDAHEVKKVLGVQPERPFGEIAFDHDRHLKMAGIRGQCVPCHGGVVEPGKATTPPMSQCFGCHEHEQQWSRGQCGPCHESSDLRRILPQTFLRHDGDFSRRHGQLAVEQKELCQSCHSQSQCNDCHDASQDLSIERRRPERVESSFVHRADFISRHAIEARAQPARCATCHTPASCDSCHQARGVSGNLSNGSNPHPPGWVGTSAAARSAHGIEARRDILACASCHEQGPATNCIRCHKVGAFGGNPHPGGWKSARSPNESMCRYCHE